jgi:hypothetical protein
VSTMTAEHLPLDPGVQTPAAPDPVPLVVNVEAVRLTSTSESAIAAGPPRIVLEREEDGTYLISSCDGHVVGVGPIPQEALSDFWTELRGRVAYLRGNRERLHGRMVEELASLERDFPWV